MAKECRPEGQDWQILRRVSPTQSHQSNGAAEKAVSTVLGLAGTYLAVLKDKIPSFDMTTHSPMCPWTIRHAAWILTRYNVRRDKRMTPYKKTRGQKYRKILPLGEQVLALLPGANVNQLLTRNQLKLECCPDSSRFLQHQPRIRSQKQRRRRRMIPVSQR